MSVRLITLSTVSAMFLMACATSQESPIYQQSTKYKASSPYSSATSSTTGTTTPVRYVQGSSSTATTSPVVYSAGTTTTYQTTPAGTGYTRIDHECLNRETNRQLIGGAVGGTLGAVAGKEFIGGTKGTIIGAAVGGTAGYGIGDKSINCDPVNVPITQSSTLTTVQPQYVQSSQPQYVRTSQTYTAPTDQAYTGSGAGTPGYDAVMGSLGNNTTYAPTQPQPTYTQAAPPQPVYVNPQPVYVQPPTGYLPQPGAQPSMTNIASQPLYTAPGYGAHLVTEGDTVYSMARSRCVSVEEIRQINGLDGQFKIRLGEQIQLPNSRC